VCVTLELARDLGAADNKEPEINLCRNLFLDLFAQLQQRLDLNLLLRQYLYFFNSEASKLSTCWVSRERFRSS